MLGRVKVIKDGTELSQIYAHRGQVSSLSIRRDEDVEPSVCCSGQGSAKKFLKKNSE